MVELHTLKRPRGANKAEKRVGRGVGSGLGKTSGKGHKGAKARAGSKQYLGFEGGQMPLIRRVPKRGFNNKAFAERFVEVNLEQVARLGIKEVSPAVLKEKGLLNHRGKVKVLGRGEVKEAVVVTAHAFSKSAIEKITAAGGKAIIINK